VPRSRPSPGLGDASRRAAVDAPRMLLSVTRRAVVNWFGEAPKIEPRAGGVEVRHTPIGVRPPPLGRAVEHGRMRPRKLDLVCAACGYGIVRARPPERCPMCQSLAGWDHAPWRPFRGH
jgi:hypothetical protein